MKIIIIFLIALSNFAFSQNQTIAGKTNIVIPVLNQLQARSGTNGSVISLLGRETIGDGKGGTYFWDPASTETEDLTFLNVIKVTGVNTGRWKRVFARAMVYPQGILVNNGGVKTMFIGGTTNSNGEITLNLTENNQANGTNVFTEIWSIIPQPMTDATGPGTAIQSYKKSWASNLKTVTYGFYRANAVTITLGLLLTPVASIGAGTNVQFRIEGI